MSKQLRITYGDVVLYDGEVSKLTWSENANGAVEVKADPPRAARPSFAQQLQAKRAQPALVTALPQPE